MDIKKQLTDIYNCKYIEKCNPKARLKVQVGFPGKLEKDVDYFFLAQQPGVPRSGCDRTFTDGKFKEVDDKYLKARVYEWKVNAPTAKFVLKILSTLKPRTYFYTNAIRCPEAKSFKYCKRHTKNMINLLKPKVVVTIGSIARTVIRDIGWQGVTVHIVHPSYIRYNQLNQKEIIKTALEEMKDARNRSNRNSLQKFFET